MSAYAQNAEIASLHRNGLEDWTRNTCEGQIDVSWHRAALVHVYRLQDGEASWLLTCLLIDRLDTFGFRGDSVERLRMAFNQERFGK